MEGSCVVEYTLGSVSVFTELPEKIPAVILKVSFKNPRRYDGSVDQQVNLL